MDTTRKRIAWIAGAVMGVLLLAVLCVRLFVPVSGEPASHSVTGMTDATQPAPAAAYRIVRAYEGKLAVFLPGADTPETVYDVPVAVLPQEEQERLKAGVEAADAAALASLIEDYTG